MGPTERIVDADGVVCVGSVVFALIEPTPGHETAFNHWYERDHFYTAGLAAPGVFSAARFIAPHSGLHLALYFVLPGYDDARAAFATEQVTDAAAEDRLFTERTHLHTWSYDVAGSWHRATGGVPDALVLDHRYPAITVTMHDGGRSEETPAAPAAERDVDTVLRLRPRHEIMASTWAGNIDPTYRRIDIEFHTRADPAPLDSGSAPDVIDVVWTSTFLAAVPGTDTHVADRAQTVDER